MDKLFHKVWHNEYLRMRIFHFNRPNYKADVVCKIGYLWFLENYSSLLTNWWHYCMANAAISGHLDVIIWLHENRDEERDERVMDFAAQNGHLEIVKWLP